MSGTEPLFGLILVLISKVYGFSFFSNDIDGDDRLGPNLVFDLLSAATSLFWVITASSFLPREILIISRARLFGCIYERFLTYGLSCFLEGLVF
jgi:hypothetical protein